MNKLLAAEMKRLSHDLFFKIALLFSLGLAAFLAILRKIDLVQNAAIYDNLEGYKNVDDLMFQTPVLVIFAVAVFIGLFIGTEFSDGTIRNKMIVGHLRSRIYLSKLAVCAIASTIIILIGNAVMILLGELLIGHTAFSPTFIAMNIAISIVAVLATAAIQILISMAVQSKPMAAIFSIILVIVLLAASIYVVATLAEPEYIEVATGSYVDEGTGDMQIETRMEKNPRYITGTTREVYSVFADAIPLSQLISILGRVDVASFKLFMLYDCLIIIVATGAGLAIFGRRDLK